MRDVYHRVVTTKSDPAIPCDMIKSAATMLGEDICYFPAWRKLQAEGHRSIAASAKAFQLLRPNVQKLETLNPGSTTNVTVDESDRVLCLFICPGYINEVLKYVCPVISVDSAHLKSVFRGGIQIYSGLTAMDEIYIYAFAIVYGNEDYKSWKYSNDLFEAVCPILKEQNIDSLHGGPNQFFLPPVKNSMMLPSFRIGTRVLVKVWT